MLVEEITYGIPVAEDGGRQVDVSIFAEGGYQRRQIAEDCAAAGLFVRGHGELTQLAALAAEDGFGRLGELVVLDVPEVDAQTLALLARLDMEAARRHKRLAVTTTLASLDDVFGCLDQSAVNILVRPTRADRVLLFARLQASLSGSVVREMGQEDKLALVRLTEQLEALMRNLGNTGAAGAEPVGNVVAFDSAPNPSSAEALVRRTRVPLPDPRLVRTILRQRQKRNQLFQAELFADPAWDMLLDLTAARAEHRRVSVTSLCIASGVPATTALRWIGQMVEAGLFARVKDTADARRAFIELTDRSADAMARYFAELTAAEALAA